MSRVPELLRESLDLFVERNAVYRDNYLRQGPLLLSLFPNGIPAIRDTEAAQRLHLINSCLMKLSRYAMNFEHGGHLDSARDLIVYAAMLTEATNDHPR